MATKPPEFVERLWRDYMGGVKSVGDPQTDALRFLRAVLREHGLGSEQFADLLEWAEADEEDEHDEHIFPGGKQGARR